MDTNASSAIINGSDVIPAANNSDDVRCREDTPYSRELLGGLTTVQLTLLLILWLCVIIIFANFLEEAIFIIRHFHIFVRRQKTICVLALMPVYALCAIIGVMVPRAVTLVDLVANSYLGFALFNWMSLVDDYISGAKAAQTSKVTVLSLATPPCCCCCLCLPKFVYKRKTYTRLLAMVFQVTLIRPLLAFIAAVLWVDGQYIPSKMGNNAFTYMTIMNAMSTILAFWGMVIIQRAFRETLKEFSLMLKFIVLKLTMIGTVLSNAVIGILASQGVITCTEAMSVGTRASRIDNSFTIFWMLLMAFLGRVAFRRKRDGIHRRSSGTERVVLDDNGSATVEHDDTRSPDTDKVAFVE